MFQEFKSTNTRATLNTDKKKKRFQDNLKKPDRRKRPFG